MSACGTAAPTPEASRPAPAAPPSSRSRSFLLVLALANAGGVTAFLPLLSLLLPMKVGAVAGGSRLGVLTAGVIAGALAASVANIVFGLLSDRSVARGGGRRRWLAGGIAANAAAYALVAAADSPVAIVIAVVLFQIGVNALLAPLLAIMADEVADADKGLLGGMLALGAPAASACGTLLVAMPLAQSVRLALVPAAAGVACLPLLLTPARPIQPDTRPAPAVADLRRDLLVAWAARLLVQIAGNVLSLYLFFYFESIVPDPPGLLAARVGNLLMLAYLLPLAPALLAGRLSDRTGRRKPFLLAAAIVSALGLIGLALAHSWAAGAAAFCLYASGSAVFLALHAGFAMQLLPDPRHRGRDLGLLNLTNTLPALAGPLLAWTLATPDDFAPVMTVLAGLALAGGLAILAVRGRA